MVALDSGRAVLEKASQRELRARKRDVRPRDLLGLDQHCLEAFLSSSKCRRTQPGAKEHVDLPRAQYICYREQGAYLHVGERFLLAFTRRALLERFAVLHESCGDGPIAPPRLYGAPANQNAPLMLGHAAHHDLGVRVMNQAASPKSMARHVIACGDLECDGLATVTAEVQQRHHNLGAFNPGLPGSARNLPTPESGAGR